MEPFEFQPHYAWSNTECCRTCSHGAEHTPRTARLARFAWIAHSFWNKGRNKIRNSDTREIALGFAIELAHDDSAQLASDSACGVHDALECNKIFFDEAQEAVSESIVSGVV